ncbi:histidine phosphatase family protein [Mycobacterium marinum]|uniref:histidine phosphatase family protein n=1 Tax=Mycobacterium marinum TaxID=1781 RepID=UPI003565DE66
MTDVTRLILVSHGMTDAMAVGRFPDDEPLNHTGRRGAARLESNRDSRQYAGPERRCCQSAELLGLQAVTEPRLADLDCGHWRGSRLADIAPADLTAWLSDPGQAPHGGESILELIDRVAGWLASLQGNTVAVTHPAVIRATILVALDGCPKSFWRIDVAPLSRIALHYRDRRWTLRL